MEHQQLTKDELTELKSIIYAYNANTYVLDELNQEMKSLVITKDRILNDVKKIADVLDTIREQETLFKDKIFKKYGDISLNVETLTIV